MLSRVAKRSTKAMNWMRQMARRPFHRSTDTPAGGTKTKSEIHGVGEEEFVPWPLGPTL